MSYFKNIGRGIKTSWKGMSLTLRHLWNARRNRMANDIQAIDYFDRTNGRVTVQFPHESITVPDNGRYQLDCEIDDCIVCDKCVKVCPVDCIEIDAIKSSEIINYASDGSPIRLYAAKFDIDMAKCCFCGLCTTVCPTECLTMTNEYDFSVADVNALNFAFAKLTPEVADEKRKLYEQFVAEKKASEASVALSPIGEKKVDENKSQSLFKPKFGVKTNGAEIKSEETNGSQEKVVEEIKPKPAFKPKFAIKPLPINDKNLEKTHIENRSTVELKPLHENNNQSKPHDTKPKPSFKPKFTLKPLNESGNGSEEKVEEIADNQVVNEPEKPKTTFRPKFKIQNKN